MKYLIAAFLLSYLNVLPAGECVGETGAINFGLDTTYQKKELGKKK